MGIPPSEVGYTSATTTRGDHKVHKEHVVALGGGDFTVCIIIIPIQCLYNFQTVTGPSSVQINTKHAKGILKQKRSLSNIHKQDTLLREVVYYQHFD
jgi:hypothetical protein